MDVEGVEPDAGGARAKVTAGHEVGGAETDVDPGLRRGVTHPGAPSERLGADAGPLVRRPGHAQVVEARLPGPLHGAHADPVAAVIVVEGVQHQGRRRAPFKTGVEAWAAVD